MLSFSVPAARGGVATPYQERRRPADRWSGGWLPWRTVSPRCFRRTLL